MGDAFLDNRAVQVIGSEAERHLGESRSQHNPVRFDMPEIIEHQPGSGDHLETAPTARPTSTEPVSVRVISKRYKRLKTIISAGG